MCNVPVLVPRRVRVVVVVGGRRRGLRLLVTGGVAHVRPGLRHQYNTLAHKAEEARCLFSALHIELVCVLEGPFHRELERKTCFLVVNLREQRTKKELFNQYMYHLTIQFLTKYLFFSSNNAFILPFLVPRLAMSASLQKTRKHVTSELLNGLPEPTAEQV